MVRGKPIHITPSVLEWALSESGYEVDTLAPIIGAAPALLRAWLKGDEQPNITALRALARELKRPLAAFLLPRPPKLHKPVIEFRAPRGSGRADLNVIERQRIREAARLQRMLAWVSRELGREAAAL